MDAQAGLRPCYSQTPEDRSSRVEALNILYFLFIIMSESYVFYKWQNLGRWFGKHNVFKSPVDSAAARSKAMVLLLLARCLLLLPVK